MRFEGFAKGLTSSELEELSHNLGSSSTEAAIAD